LNCGGLERAAGIEPATYSLGSCRSTTELRPQSRFFEIWLFFGSLSFRPDTLVYAQQCICCGEKIPDVRLG
jgi:hypothetical protein